MGLGSLFASGLTAMASASGDSSSLPAAHDDFWYQMPGGSTAGMRVTPRTARSLAVVFACVAKKATTIATPKIRFYRLNNDGTRTETRNHPLYDLLNKSPNDLQTAFSFRQQMQGWLELWGNACAEIVPGPRGPVDQLLPMHPSRVQVERLANGRFRYRYSDPLTGMTRVLVQDEVFHLRDMCDEIGIGQSRIAAAAAPHGVALAQQDSIGRVIQNDSRPAAIITGTNFETKEDEAAYLRQWESGQSGKNRGRTALMPPGVDIKALSMSQRDAQALELLQYSDTQLCALYNMFPFLIGLGDGKTSTFGSAEQASRMHVTQCVRPMAKNWEEAVAMQLMTSDGFEAETDLSDLLVGDTLAQASLIYDLSQVGVLVPDDGRAMLGMNPHEGGVGKRPWNMGNMSPLDQTNRGGSNGGGDQGKSRSRTSGGNSNAADREDAAA